LTPCQRELILTNKSILIDYLVSARITSDALIEAAMTVCVRHGDSEAACQEMREQCMNLSPKLQADLLKHFRGIGYSPRDGALTVKPVVSGNQFPETGTDISRLANL
jgi:hypothetical protein